MTEMRKPISIRVAMERLSKLFQYVCIGIEITICLLLLFAPDVTFLGMSLVSWSKIFVTLFLVVYISEEALSVRTGSTPWQRLLLPCFSLVVVLFASIYSINLTVLVLLSILPEVLLMALGIVIFGFKKKGANFDQESLEDTFSLFMPTVVIRLLFAETMVIATVLSTALKGFKISDVPGYRYDSAFPTFAFIILVVVPLELFVTVILVKYVPESLHVLIPEPLRVLNIPDPLRVLHIALSIYAIPWAYGLYVTARINPHQVNSDIVHLKQGVFGRADFPLRFIVSAKVVSDEVVKQLRSKKKRHDDPHAQLLVPETQIVEILLSQEIVVRKILGDVTSRKLLVSIDEPAPFLAALSPNPVNQGV
jgi:hypothetical protein